VSGTLPSANGGTASVSFYRGGSGLVGKNFTFPNASATVLTDNAVVSVAQGGIEHRQRNEPLWREIRPSAAHG
jgi:hypothetical protein